MKLLSFIIFSFGLTSLTLTSCKKDIETHKTVIFAPDQNQSEVHIFGNDNGINQSGINSPEIEGGAGTYLGAPVAVRAVFTFDLSVIPANSKIISAKLSLFSNPTPINGEGSKRNANSGPDNTFLINRVTSKWIGSEITWQNQPTASEINQVVIPHTDSAFLDLIDVNVRNLVQSMVVPNENNGFQIRLKTETPYNWRIFCSSKYVNKSKHPKLVVVYEYEK